MKPILIHIIYLTMLSVTQNIASNDGMAVNKELKKMLKMAVEAYFKAVFRHLSRGTGKRLLG